MNYLLPFLVLVGISVQAQIPPGYYDDAQGLTGQVLRQALHDIIDGHSAQSYSSMWGLFEDTDNKGGNTVWDIYSDVPGGTPVYTYQFVTDQCGQYGGEGDCFNREHSFPQSWYGSGTPMKSDFFHVYPTDGYVNGQRGNDPYGEVDAAFWTSTNGSKSGPNVFPGFIGTVFEPIDEYKGDLARGYFYMLTRYMDVSGSWSSPMLSAGDLSAWAEDLLVEWHLGDPVSLKEIDRNNAIHDIQDNRNPYIDHPEWVEEIWSSSLGTGDLDRSSSAVWYSNATLNYSGLQPVLNAVVYSLSGQEVANFHLKSQVQFKLDLPKGVYVMHSVNAEESIVLKFVVD